MASAVTGLMVPVALGAGVGVQVLPRREYSDNATGSPSALFGFGLGFFGWIRAGREDWKGGEWKTTKKKTENNQGEKTVKFLN